MPNNNDSVLSFNHPANDNHRHSSVRSYTYHMPFSPPVFSLGWELEANHSAARLPAGINQISDGSVDGDGTEYVVLPSVTRSPRFVLGLLKDLVHSPKLNTDKSCGFHIHMSVQNAKLPKLRQWSLATEALAQRIEELAFRAVPEARKENQYCRKIQLTGSGTSFPCEKYSNSRRYHWLNTVEMFRPNGIRTVEVRLLGNTHRWKYLLAWSTFSLLLGREGWNLAHKPFTSWQNSIDRLSDFLKAIELDIKPLSKKHEPIPAWVYSNLKNLGIDFTAFDRPMKKLVQAEADVSDHSRVFYSDNQETIPNESNDDESNDDEEDNSCPCGCGEEGRCYSQMHFDGDCASNDCTNCHSEGNCAPEHCGYCRRDAHDHGSLCAWSSCNVCSRQRAISQIVIASTPALEPRRGYTYITSLTPLLTITGIENNPYTLNIIANSMLNPHEEALSLERERSLPIQNGGTF
jgi:hypothetical protein